MSGIFKGDSIYKSGGGGGGGYADGGQLVDGDLIKVENKTISSYENVSRDELNFYFEVKDGEVLNSVIELTNEYNSTVHVYILQNGVYVPIGNIGGNTVNAGEKYNINILGNSFNIEQIVEPLEDSFILIFNEQVPVKKIKSQIWTTEYLDIKFTGVTIGGAVQNIPQAWYAYNDEATYGKNGLKYGLLYNELAANLIENNYLSNGWRIPTKQDVEKLINNNGGNQGSTINALSSTTWSGGTNTTGFSALPNGNKDVSSFFNVGIGCSIRYKNSSSQNKGLVSWQTGNLAGFNDNIGRSVGIRLVKDV